MMSADCEVNFTKTCENSSPEPLEIYAKRIISKWEPAGDQEILYDVKRDTADDEPIKPYVKTPLRLCIKDLGGMDVRCLTMTKFMVHNTEQEFICNHKVELDVYYKLVLCVEYANSAGDIDYKVYTLPKDIVNGAICLLKEDGTPYDSYGDVFPIDLENEQLEIEQENGEYVFEWSRFIPFDDPDWEGEIPGSIFNDPTLDSYIVIKCTKVIFDVLGECTCQDQAAGTRVDLNVNADISDKIGIVQGICISGTPLDICQF